jgi:hypothetical protein
VTTKRIARLPKDAGIPIIVGDASWDGSPQAVYVALVVAGYRPVRDCICNIMTREPSYSVTALVCSSRQNNRLRRFGNLHHRRDM